MAVYSHGRVRFFFVHTRAACSCQPSPLPNRDSCHDHNFFLLCPSPGLFFPAEPSFLHFQFHFPAQLFWPRFQTSNFGWAGTDTSEHGRRANQREAGGGARRGSLWGRCRPTAAPSDTLMLPFDIGLRPLCYLLTSGRGPLCYLLTSGCALYVTFDIGRAGPLMLPFDIGPGPLCYLLTSGRGPLRPFRRQTCSNLLVDKKE